MGNGWEVTSFPEDPAGYLNMPASYYGTPVSYDYTNSWYSDPNLWKILGGFGATLGSSLLGGGGGGGAGKAGTTATAGKIPKPIKQTAKMVQEQWPQAATTPEQEAYYYGSVVPALLSGEVDPFSANILRLIAGGGPGMYMPDVAAMRAPYETMLRLGGEQAARLYDQLLGIGAGGISGLGAGQPEAAAAYGREMAMLPIMQQIAQQEQAIAQMQQQAMGMYPQYGMEALRLLPATEVQNLQNMATRMAMMGFPYEAILRNIQEYAKTLTGLYAPFTGQLPQVTTMEPSQGSLWAQVLGQGLGALGSYLLQPTKT